MNKRRVKFVVSFAIREDFKKKTEKCDIVHISLFFSCKSNSRIANVRLSHPNLSASQNHAYHPNLSLYQPISHYANHP